MASLRYDLSEVWYLWFRVDLSYVPWGYLDSALDRAFFMACFRMVLVYWLSLLKVSSSIVSTVSSCLLMSSTADSRSGYMEAVDSLRLERDMEVTFSSVTATFTSSDEPPRLMVEE